MAWDSICNVVDVDQEEKRRDNSALWDPLSHFDTDTQLVV